MAEERERLLSMLLEARDRPVVVEGRRDAEELRRLGFSEVFVLKGGLYEFAELVKSKATENTIIVLTDFDSGGEKIHDTIRGYLHSLGMKTNDSLRKKLRALFIANKINTVQALVRL